MANAKNKPAWNSKRISSKKDANGFRIVSLPAVGGLTASEVKEVFAFEREHLGTVRATIRMNKRAQGTTVPAVARLGEIPAGLTGFYPDPE